MQPYFLPYIGYYQLIQAVDTFIVYDNIKYTKKGWINRNRILLNNTDVMFSLPIKKDSDVLNVVERELATDFDPIKLLNQFRGAYARAPYFNQTFPLLERIICSDGRNLFRYIRHSIVQMCEYLGITTKICISSHIAIDHRLKGQDKVIALCQAVGAGTYINSIGGMELYDRDVFRTQGIELKFLKVKSFEYLQFGAPFVPWLSIVDLLMFNSLDTVHNYIDTYYELN